MRHHHGAANGSHRKRLVAPGALALASMVGLFHALSSFHWALGGQWLLSTLGDGAMELVERAPGEAALYLGAIGLIKTAAVIVPLAGAARLLPRPRLWRALCWAGAAALVVYGSAHVVVSSAVLLGVIRPEGGYNTQAMLGHALLWGPAFLLWGAALLAWLVFSAHGER